MGAWRRHANTGPADDDPGLAGRQEFESCLRAATPAQENVVAIANGVLLDDVPVLQAKTRAKPGALASPPGARPVMKLDGCGFWLTVRAAQDFDAFYLDRLCEPENTSDLLILSFDGKGVAMRHEDLREATRNAAERTTRRLETRLTSGEKRNRKRRA